MEGQRGDRGGEEGCGVWGGGRAALFTIFVIVLYLRAVCDGLEYILHSS